jgi:hypothetical protein
VWEVATDYSPHFAKNVATPLVQLILNLDTG